jgi:DNA repair exonuclease SbcCD nuclease subunit
MGKRIAVVGDLHLGKHLFGVDLTPFVLRAMHDFFRFCLRVKPEAAVVLGDVYDTPTPNFKVQKALIQWCNEFERARIPLVVLSGNHDSLNTPGIGSALEPVRLSPFKYIRVVDRPTAIAGCLFLPFPSAGLFSHPVDYWVECSDKMQGSKAPVVAFSHLNIDGAKLGSQDFVYRGGEHVLPKEIRDRLLLVVNGHIHKSQVNGIVVMPGSIQRLSFGEWQDVKEFLLVEGTVAKHYRIPGLDLRSIEVDVSGWANSGRAPTTDEVIAELRSKNVDGAFVKIIPFVDSSTAVEWGAVTNALYADGAEHVFMGAAVKAEKQSKPIPKQLLSNPLDVAKTFVRRRVGDKKERIGIMRMFKQVRKRMEQEKCDGSRD